MSEMTEPAKVDNALRNDDKQKYYARVHDYFYFPPNYDPPEYDPSDDPYFNPDQTVMYLGTRGSGKTSRCLAMIMAMRRYYPNVFCMTRTSSNNFWQQFIPADKVWGDYDEEALTELLDLSFANLADWRHKYVETKKATGLPYSLLVLEDLMDSALLKSSPSLRTLLYNGRHAGLSAHILTQDYAGLTRGQRDNMDKIIVFKTTDFRTRQVLADSYGVTFLKLLDRVTDDNNTVLVINNRKRVPREHMIYKWTLDYDKTVAKYLRSPKYVMGNKKCWNGVDPAEQREEYPYTEFVPSRAMASKQFERTVGEEENEEDATSPLSLFKMEDHAAEEEEPEEESWIPWFAKDWSFPSINW